MTMASHLRWSLEAMVVMFAAAASSAVLIAALLPFLRRHALAKPNPRSSHVKPTPQGGGAAVVPATIVVVLAVTMLSPHFSPSEVLQLAPLFSAVVCLAAVGALDDISPLGVRPRLALQLVATIAMVALLPSQLRVFPGLPFVLERALEVIVSLWFINLTNFMDGIDWMTVAEVLPVTVGLSILGLIGALPGHAIVVALALGGAMLGFAPFNRPVARLFLGDVGSLPIGCLLAWLLIQLAAQGHLIAALLLPLYYLADATITLLRRIISGEQFWEAHRSHFYQSAAQLGFSVPAIVGRVFMVNATLVALAVTTVLVPGVPSALFSAVCGSALVAWLLVSFTRHRS
jgi:UDP-N-acetylmuramyl pentapeptide phosphotransferase/UDP-N-acetylglucosamine-1-phosphate transferase